MSNASQLLVDHSIEQRRELLAQLLKEKAQARRTFPVSFAQQRLWFIDQLEPESSAYNIPIATWLGGHINIAAMQQALTEIVRRHEALRTSFAEIDGQPAQVVNPPGQVMLPVVDLSALGPSRSRVEARRLTTEEAQKPFDLKKDLMLRSTLVKLSEGEAVMLFTLHHIAGDGWSLGVLKSEVATLYGAYSQGNPSPLPELPVQYADFARWQREWLQGDALDKQLQYWMKRLENITPLELPTDRPRPAVQSYRGSVENLFFPKGVSERLKQLSHREGVTLFILLLAGLKALLYRYSGQTDIVVGTPIANRNRAEIEGLIGFFVNMLVMRTDLSGEPDCRQLIARVREVALGAYAHPDIPFERLVEELQPERQLSHNPLFQITFALQNTPTPVTGGSGDPVSAPDRPGDLMVGAFGYQDTATRFDMEFHLWDRPEGINGKLIYNRDLFDAATMSRLARHFRVLLDGILDNPIQAIALLPILDEQEREQLLSEWNDPRACYDIELCPHQIFEAQVERDPNRIAVMCEDRQLTYRELNNRANQLAHHIRALGAGPESLVAIYMDRSLEMVLALMGILKAGAAYVPLDPAYPRDRVAFMLKDSGASVLLTRSDLLDALPSEGAPTVCLDADWEQISERSTSDPVSGVTPDGLAYIIYTSGSTGRPKGVQVTHRNIARLFEATRRRFDFSENDVWSLFHSYAFDFSVWELWGPLMHGGNVVVVPHWVSRSPDAFYDLLRDRKITVLNQTPSAFRQLIAADERVGQSEGLALRWVIFGGEALELQSLKPWIERHGDRVPRLVNMYGITETTVHVTYRALDRQDIEASKGSRIGGPIEDLRVYILDPNMQLQPVGIPGEMYVGGGGVARGYLGRPELTAERFVPNPFDERGGRLYKTGDLARYLADGDIEYLGRIDHQVKIRGFRIELGEIESVLSQHPLVEEAVVIARDEEGGDRRLIAYLVAKSSQEAAQEAIATGELESEQVSQWGEVFNETYDQGSPAADPTFNIVGWNSSYTGLPIAAEQMQEWLDDTVERIVGLGPRRVLEIGCGTGMLLFRIAPRCSKYLATDFSQVALDYIDRQLEGQVHPLEQVELSRRLADDFSGIQSDSFDSVVINSVVQYFPHIDYLVRVLQSSIDAVEAGGFIFVGDVRSLPLHRAFHTAVELARAGRSTSVEQFRQRVQTLMTQENELLIDPEFFFALKQRFAKISHVEILPKRGRHHNELTQFRYQAVIHIGPRTQPAPLVEWIDWQKQKMSLESLSELLTARAEYVALRGVPNARVIVPVKACELLESGNAPETVGELRRAARSYSGDGVDPEDFWSLCQEFSYDLKISWAHQHEDGRYDAVFKHSAGGGGAELEGPFPPPCEEMGYARPWKHYASNPLQGKMTREMAPELRRLLSTQLPDYMMPSAFVVLDSLPLTPSGKVDRRALPAPGQTRAELDQPYVAPRTKTEATLADIWGNIIRLDEVGIYDNFFDLGGHSLSATQVISRVREVFQVEVPLRKLFEQPTVAGFAACVENALNEKRGLQAPAIKAVSRQSELPLSFAQQRLWFINQLEPDDPTYNMPLATRMRGPLDCRALELALTEVVRRHETLRTTFISAGDRPIQVINPPLPIRMPVIDLTALDKSVREPEARRLVSEHIAMPFDLARDLMLRICLIRLGEEDSVALFTMHHIASDGWSLGVLAGEVAALYTAFNKRKPSPLPELPLQYADFAHWQRNWLQGDVLNGQLSYWKRQLEGLPLLELPTDRPRPAVQSNRGRGEYITLSKAASQSLRDLSQRKEVTLFMTLLAGFKALLYRYTNQQDIVVGIPIANRNRGEVEGLIGFFVNTLVLRTRLSDEMSFSHLLDSVKEVALGAYAHQDIPFEKLVEELHPDRDLSRTPLFQVSFSLQNNGQGTLDLPGLTISGFGGGGLKALHDMTLDMFEDGGELRGLLVYNQDLFNAETMRRFTRSFETLFEAAAGSPDTPLSLLPLLTETERRQVLIEWNSLYSDYENRNCVHHLFELQAEQNPDSLAVFYEGERISYAELNRRANHLAHYLRSAGVRPEVRVGILMDTSIDLIISILGILKAGGAYVPLDPTYPRERIEAIIDDIAAPIILTQSRVADLLGLSDIPLLRIDSEWDRVSQHDPGNPQHDLSADNLAYVIYTSGTTGKPKGVMIRHAGVCNRLLWAKSARPYHFSREDRLLHLASFSFDISVWEIFTPLCAGGALIMASSDNRYNIDYLINLISSQEVSFVNFAPSLLKTILEERGLEECNTLKTVLVGSEAVPRELPALFAERAGAALYNFYGPTEATIDATYQDFARDPSTGEVAIGRPIGKTQVYILDRRMEPVPVGLSGEIYIGGEGLARGYHNRPDQTAERFIPDPFSSEAGSRLYRTGDLGRYRSDGRIEFRGRADRQVKIRGYRIELEDIEAALREHPGVRDSIVIVAEKIHSTSDAGRLAEAMALADEEGLPSLLKTFDESAVIEILQGVESLTDEEATSALTQAD